MTKWIPLLATLTLAGLLVSPAPQAQATTLTPRVYLPLVVNQSPRSFEYVPPVGPTPTPTPVPIGFLMALTIENNTGGRLCYGVEGIKPQEDCVDQDGSFFYSSIPMGNYNFWGKGCDNTQILGNANLLYRSGTIAFACFDFAGKSTIWAKMYEME